MKKDRNNILISVLCGVVVCFMCLGVVFLLPAKEIKNFKNDRNSSSINQENKNVEEEIILGDFSSCPEGCNCTPKTTTTFTTTSEYASAITNVNGSCNAPTCKYDGCFYFSVTNGGSSGLTGYKYTCHAHTSTTYTCNSCKDGYETDGNKCSLKEIARSCIIVYNSLSKKFTITGISTNDSPVTRTAVSGHDPSTFTPTSSGEYIGQVWFQDGGTATCSTNITLPTPTPTPTTAPTTAPAKPSITCTNPTYTGSEQTIATCTNGTISNARQKNVGSYTVSCTGSGGSDAKSCSIVAAPIPTATPNCPGAYALRDKCITVEGNNAGCSQRDDGCWVPSQSSSFRVTFYDNAGTSLIATCYTYKGHLTSSCNPCCTMYDIQPGYNTASLEKSYLIGGRTFTKSTSYYCARGYDSACNTPTSAPNVTPTPKPTATPKPVVFKCYIDENNNYHWSSTPENSWIIAKDKDGKEITNSKVCPPKEACYQDTNGEYHWGEYSTKEGYTYHAEITNKDACKKDEEIGCYKKGDDYVWTKTPPADYVKVNVTYDKCEKPACYYVESKKQRVWGYYSKVNGYYKMVDENDKEIPYEGCVNNACYVCNGDKYVWGDYSDETDKCKIVPGVTDASKCNNEVPVQPTGVSISAIVYTFVAILMAFGIWFIYYSTIRKNDN